MEKKQGRPQKSEEEKVDRNGLYPHQNRLINEDAKKRDMTATWMLRQIVNWYYVAKESEAPIATHQVDDIAHEKLIQENKE